MGRGSVMTGEEAPLRINPFRGRRNHWWVFTTVDPIYIIGPFDTLERANEVGYGKLDVPFEVLELQTRDRARAKEIYKETRLERTGSITKATQHIRRA